MRRTEVVGAHRQWHLPWTCLTFLRSHRRQRSDNRCGTKADCSFGKIGLPKPGRMHQFNSGPFSSSLSHMTKEIRLNAFAMNCVAHQSPGLWTHPRDRTSEYNRLPYWLDLARTLERGRFDGLFLADVLGVYDVYGNSPDAALRNATQTPANEPLLLISAMAAAT